MVPRAKPTKPVRKHPHDFLKASTIFKVILKNEKQGQLDSLKSTLYIPAVMLRVRIHFFLVWKGFGYEFSLELAPEKRPGSSNCGRSDGIKSILLFG